MIIYLKINPKIGLNRKTNLSNHKLDVIESNPLSYFQQVEKGYYTFLQTQKLGTKIILNNMNDKDAKFNQQYIIKKIGEIKDGNNNEEKMPKWKFTYPL
jgi:dTMP kinase